MSSFGSQMRKRLDELRRAGENVPKIMAEVAEGATIEAVRVAAEKTPPMMEHWPEPTCEAVRWRSTGRRTA